jgi:hypothetical protein
MHDRQDPVPQSGVREPRDHGFSAMGDRMPKRGRKHRGAYKPERHPVVEALRAAGCDGKWRVYWCVNHYRAQIGAEATRLGVSFTEAALRIVTPETFKAWEADYERKIAERLERERRAVAAPAAACEGARTEAA